MLVLTKGARSDDYRRAQRTETFSLASEMVWAFLSPRTLGTDQVTSTAYSNRRRNPTTARRPSAVLQRRHPRSPLSQLDPLVRVILRRSAAVAVRF